MQPEPSPALLEANADLAALAFDNSFVRELPGDAREDRALRSVYGACFSPITPTPVREPKLLIHSPEVAELLGLSADVIASAEFARIFAGNALLPGMQPYAACYGGHQFGHWAGQLGDGRAITLGEVLNAKGERWELQLKGAGPTPYSRRADGRAVLRSSLREFMCSEAMHHLGVPTTRALSLVGTGDQVLRDMLYDGHPREEPGAIVCRVAPSFLRFGNFEIFSSRDDVSVLKHLADYAIRTHFPELGSPEPATYAAFLSEICRRTAVLMAHWMRVGFVHGVMNTDNMSILGLTIDYGPFGFVDHYDPDFTPNTTDASRKRYRFANQPRIARWNLSKFAEALCPLIHSVEPLEHALAVYQTTFEAEEQRMLAAKLGLVSGRATDGAADRELAQDLFAILPLVETDMTLFFRHLADVPVQTEPELSDDDLIRPLLDAYYTPEALVGDARERTVAWLRRYAARAREDDTPELARRARMHAVNPKYVLRNYIAQLAIDAAENGDTHQLVELLDVLRHPYDEQPGREAYAEKRPDWARHRVGCSMLSCSS